VYAPLISWSGKVPEGAEFILFGGATCLFIFAILLSIIGYIIFIRTPSAASQNYYFMDRTRKKPIVVPEKGEEKYWLKFAILLGSGIFNCILLVLLIGVFIYILNYFTIIPLVMCIIVLFCILFPIYGFVKCKGDHQKQEEIMYFGLAANGVFWASILLYVLSMGITIFIFGIRSPFVYGIICPATSVLAIIAEIAIFIKIINLLKKQR